MLLIFLNIWKIIRYFQYLFTYYLLLYDYLRITSVTHFHVSKINTVTTIKTPKHIF